MIPTLFIASLIVFFMIRLIPGDIVDQMVSEQGFATEQDAEAIRHALGLDVPLHIQYARWLGVLPIPDELTDESQFKGLFQGTLGDSLWKKIPVTGIILNRLPVTLELGILALIVSQLVALPIGIYSAIRQDTIGDYIGRSFAILLIAVPSFWIGTMVVVFPSIWWGWSPPVMLIHFTEDPLGNLGQFIIPAIVLGTVMSGMTMRMMRTMMLEVMRQDYIRTAWSKGLKERVVIYRHALKNALIPVITIIGYQLPILIGGAVVTESIFGLPGLGTLMLDAIKTRDYPVVSGIMLFMAIFVLIVNLGVDLTYGFLDPRTRVQYR